MCGAPLVSVCGAQLLSVKNAPLVSVQGAPLVSESSAPLVSVQGAVSVDVQGDGSILREAHADVNEGDSVLEATWVKEYEDVSCDELYGDDRLLLEFSLLENAESFSPTGGWNISMEYLERQ